jgi:hypothetical protein
MSLVSDCCGAHTDMEEYGLCPDCYEHCEFYDDEEDEEDEIISNEFKENHSAQLKEFLKRLNELVDEFHPNIYLLDNVFKGVMKIEVAILDELNK